MAKIQSIGNYADLSVKLKNHNRYLIETGQLENPKKNTRKKNKESFDKAEQELARLKEEKRILLENYTDLLDRPAVKHCIDALQKIPATEESLHRKLLEFRENHKDEFRIHGEHSLLKEGFVYLIENLSFSGWVKVGMTIDYEKRLSVYNQCDPEKRFAIMSLRWTKDRRFAESLLLNEMEKYAEKRSGEWFKIDVKSSVDIFNSVKE